MTTRPVADDAATRYALDVVDGKIIAGPHVRAAATRHLTDLEQGSTRGLTYDVDSAERIRGFFRDVLTVEIEEPSEDGSAVSRPVPFILLPEQAFITGCLFGWKNESGLRRFRRAYVEIGKGSGKALALDTPIPTPDGWSAMADLQPGDRVFSPDGRPCRVTAVSDVMSDHECYRVTFSDGAEIVADADHLWLTSALRNGGKIGPKPATESRKGQPHLRTTREIAATLAMKVSASVHPQAKWNHRVDVAAPLDLPDAELSIPPYTLGAWLGDGDSGSARITVAVCDWHIVEAIQADGVAIVEQKRHTKLVARVSLSEGRGPRYDGLVGKVLAAALCSPTVTVPSLASTTGCYPDRVGEFVSGSGYFNLIDRRRGIGNGGGTIAAVWAIKPEQRESAESVASKGPPISIRLDQLGVLNNKHIPMAYLRASRAQRLALLQGLMDTDGYVTKRGYCELCFMEGPLADGALELLRSLGIKAAGHVSDAVLNGVVVGKRHRIHFRVPNSFPLFRLKRKQDRLKALPRTRPLSSGRMIVGCDPVPSVPVKCISVDSPSRMYLAGRQMVPTHNSPLGAGIGHYMCSALGKLRAECYTAATDQDQAAIPFRDAVAMWERSQALQRKLMSNGISPVWQLTHRYNGSFYRPISSAKKGKSGIRPYYALIDEVHEHPNNDVIEMLRAGTKGNQEALIFEITNSGFDKKSVCGQEHDQSVRIVHGDEPNDAWFSFVCSLDDGDEPFDDESCWVKANPSLGVTIKAPFIREQVAEAKGMPSKEGIVRRLHFCQWTESEKSAIPRELWMKAETQVDPDVLHEAGWRCFGGLDLSRVNDLSAFTLTWVPVETKDQWQFVSKTWFWSPKDTIAQRAKRDHAPYDVWANEGHLEAPPGKMLKFGWIADALMDLCSRYKPVMIGCDEYGLKQLIEKLSEMGQTLPCVVHPQGFNKREVGTRREFEDTGAEKIELWMPDSINKLEAALLEERIKIDINPVMRMCSQGVVYTSNRTGHRMFDKEKATTRIDGMISLAMSIGVATVEGQKAPSYQMFVLA